ncbi:MAG: hypothetical protein EOP46_19460, partial [Sphingobacteriaceae bacterium]
MLLHPDFLKTKALLYDKQGLVVENLQTEKESSEYGACTFTLNGQRIIFRVAKVTPKKPGLFVAIWKRADNGSTKAYDFADDFDLMVISVTIGDNFGQFVFTKSILKTKGIISYNGKGGKRGIRVYPPHVQNLNKQA